MRSLLISVLLLVLTISIYPQRSLSLEESIKIALQKNTTLQKSIVAIPQYEASVKSAYGSLLPSISADGSWNWSYRPNVETQRVVVNGIPVNLAASPKDSRNYSLGIGGYWTLFNGFSNYASISQSKNDLEAARASLRRSKENTVFQTVTMYYAVLRAQQILGAREEYLKYNRKNLEIIQEKNKLGAVTLADVYNQQVTVGNAELAMIQAQNDWETSKSNLLNFLGLNVLEDVALTDTTSVRSKIDTTDVLNDYKDLSQMVETALSNRSDYKSAKYSLESSYNGVTVAEGGFFPQLTNSINIGSNNDKLDFNKLYDSRTYNVGLTLSIPIFSGWSTSANVQVAKVRAKTNEVDVTELERQIKIDLKKNYLDLQAAKKQVQVNESNVVAAEQNRRIEQEKYNLGSGTLVDLLLASSNYITALQNSIDSRFAYIVLKSQLEFYLGVLDYKRFE